MLRKTLLALPGLVFAATTVAAMPPGIELSRDHHQAFVLNPPVSIVHNLPGDTGLVAIFDNIGKKYPHGTYWCCTGNSMMGPDALPGFSEWWLAAAFTPTSDHTVTQIEVAATYIQGTNSMTLSIANDSGGVPGQVIKSWVIKKLPALGSCCIVDVQDDKGGVPVTAGTQYWITLTTDAKEANTWSAWQYNDTDQVDAGITAVYCSDDNGGDCDNNDQWTPESYTPALAFAVKGK
ncbi:MAG TPA: choice-of-anchor R domain-containing protein [Rhizomicrobium sp.]|nr:choice-of-anchor R domain-containing protein [Rhizomicrobium sp.]